MVGGRFVLIGFQAFADFDNYWEGILNACIVILLAYLLLSLFQGPKASWEKRESDNIAEKVLHSMDVLFSSLEHQLNIAQLVIDRMPRDDQDAGEDEEHETSTSESEEHDNDNVPLLIKG